MAGDAAPSGEAPAGRLAGRWVPWLVIGLWVALAAVMVPLSGRLSSVTKDRAVDALPASAESTKVAALEDKLPGGEENTFVFVYHRAGGLTADDSAAVERHYNTLAKQYPPKVAPPAGENDAGAPTQRSDDGKAMVFTLNVSTTYGEPAVLIGPMRDAAKDRPAGLDLDVTGPAGIDADMDAVFDGIDVQVFLTTIIVVTVLLILTYRSPVLWIIPLVAVGVAALTAMATVYLLVKGFGIVINSQNSALLTILVFGVGTDYALLLIARYREALHHHENVRVAMVHALRGAAPAIIASAATVVAGMLCLLAADLNETRGLGPIGAAGILCALVAMLTLFPAVLVVLGRRIFWPAIPHFNTAMQEKPGPWGTARHRDQSPPVGGDARFARSPWRAHRRAGGQHKHPAGAGPVPVHAGVGHRLHRFASALPGTRRPADDGLHAGGVPGASPQRRQGRPRCGPGPPG
ncbi:hypothetical protein GCM10020218_098790 [Dactylosporangium vinaceum]